MSFTFNEIKDLKTDKGEKNLIPFPVKKLLEHHFIQFYFKDDSTKTPSDGIIVSNLQNKKYYLLSFRNSSFTYKSYPSMEKFIERVNVTKVYTDVDINFIPYDNDFSGISINDFSKSILIENPFYGAESFNLYKGITLERLLMHNKYDGTYFIFEKFKDDVYFRKGNLILKYSLKDNNVVIMRTDELLNLLNMSDNWKGKYFFVSFQKMILSLNNDLDVVVY